MENNILIDDNKIDLEQPITLVYQIGKVGSSTIYYSLKEFLNNKNIVHIHTIYNTLESNNDKDKQVIKGRKVFNLLKENKNLDFKIITAVREPIQRFLSDIFQNIESRYKHFLDDNNCVKHEEVKTFVKNTISKHDPIQTWFNNEFLPSMDFTPLVEDLDKTKPYFYFKKDNKEIVLYKLEELNHFQKDIFKLLFNEDIPVSIKNETKDKSYYADYKIIAKELKFDKEFLFKFYNENSVTRFFYSQEEINKFIDKWS